ncbi:hypothetical protein GCM10009124_00420 [Shewanella xiamenensis]|nr:hypothetical protein NUITMVS1_06630 [Shewanella xiamenensis]BDQ64797.1 hypothetical protein NUITMVS2_06090 [Shewanella xiamenensis]GGM77564.1 hypothetical protein GCM10009124_00420 [Shewanella xiamenensis]GLD77995.1 hypothetical protein NUITMVS3_24260 [Shewanella xiamenensis]
MKNRCYVSLFSGKSKCDLGGQIISKAIQKPQNRLACATLSIPKQPKDISFRAPRVLSFKVHQGQMSTTF